MNDAGADLADLPTRERLRELVDDFYSGVRADDLLGPVFDGLIGDNWGPHLARMTEFWCTVMLNSHTFRGNVFGKHMALQGIRPEHFLRWLSLWKQHCRARFSGDVLDRLVETAQGIARNLFYGFFGIFPVFLYDGDTATGFRPE